MAKRYMAVQVINEDHYAIDVFYAPNTHILTKKNIGTRYVCMAVRTFVNPNDAADIRAVHALQDAIKVEQKSAVKFEIPNWDQVTLKKIRDALLALGIAGGGLDSSRMFWGKRTQSIRFSTRSALRQAGAVTRSTPRCIRLLSRRKTMESRYCRDS